MLPETEGALRDWLRGNEAIAAIIGDRTYFTMPQQDAPTTPFVVFYRVGGAPDTHKLDHPDFIIEAWDKNKIGAATLASVIAEEINESNDRAPVTTTYGVVLAGLVNFGPVPNGGNPTAKRYRLDTTFHMRAT